MSNEIKIDTKGENQDINNPRKNWGLIKEELEYYNSKYKENDYGQTLQGFIRNQSIKEERELSKVKAKVLYPNNKKKQQEYINYIHDHGLTSHLGRNKRCVWEIPTKPNPESHFATFPDTLIEIPIKAGCPKFICKKCGLPREKIYKKIGELSTNWSIALKKYHKDQRREGKLFSNINDFIGYSDCGCNSGFTSGIVLDPFAGIGTTLLTAWKLGLNYIGFEISKKYCKIANKKLSKTNFKRLDDFIYFESKVINEQEV